MPKITVVTVCLNAVRTIEQTIRSVLEQNYPHLEYILVDGGSTDGTLDIIKKYEAGLYRVISESDNGIYDAFNKGINMASGDIVCILNADDFYAPWALKTIARAYDANPDCDVLYGKVVVIDEVARVWKVYALGSPSELGDRMSVSHPAVFLPKRTYDRWGVFDDAYKIAGDWDYLLRVSRDGAVFRPINAVFTAFRSDGASGALSPRQLAESRLIYERYLDKNIACRKIMKMKLKYCARCLLKATGTYGLYAKYRDRRIFPMELSGEYTGDAFSMWDTIQREHDDG